MIHLFILFSAAFLTLWEGVVIHNFWYWFLVPLGAPEVAYAHILGLIMLARLVRGSSSRGYDPRSDDEKQFDFLAATAMATVTLTILLGIGFIIHAFI